MLCEINSISSIPIPVSSIIFFNAITIPSETPFSELCVVGTVDFTKSEPVFTSIATAFVKVPPTSIPTLILRLFI